MASPNTPSPHDAGSDRRVWLMYGGGCVLAWLLYVLAGAEFERGLWQLWQAVYQATLNLTSPMILGAAVLPWVRMMQRRDVRPAVSSTLHAVAALLFGAAWQLCDFLFAWRLYGVDHAQAMLMQTILWRAIWGVVVYIAIATAFTAMLQTRRARAAALAARAPPRSPRRRPSRRSRARSWPSSAASWIRTSCSTR